MIGAGSFGTAIAVLLARAARAHDAADAHRGAGRARSAEQRVNEAYLPGRRASRRSCASSPSRAASSRADYVFLAVPSTSLAQRDRGARRSRARPPRRRSSRSRRGSSRPTASRADRRAARALRRRTASRASAGPRTRRRWCTHGAGLVAAAFDEGLAEGLAAIFTRAGVVCELSNDPIGVELAGVAKNAAALAAGATEAQGLNAAGAAAGHIFAEVWRFAEAAGARPESFIGLAGAGDLVATALAPMSRNRRAGELLAAGRARRRRSTSRVAQAVEALESVPLLARAIERAGLDAPVTERPLAPDRRRRCRSTTGSRSCARRCRRARAGSARAASGSACASWPRRRPAQRRSASVVMTAS